MTNKTRTAAALALMAVLGLILVFEAQTVRADGALDVVEPYARAVPPGQPNSAVFLQLQNGGDQDRALIGAESQAADVVELHTHLEEDGMIKMRQVARIDVPAGASISLEPGGLHVMLIGLKRQLQPGDDVAMTLKLDDGTELAVTAPVRKIMPMGRR
ncbi:MAG: copper chaperone PCu(A)C [Thiohalocapsa sp.]